MVPDTSFQVNDPTPPTTAKVPLVGKVTLVPAVMVNVLENALLAMSAAGKTAFVASMSKPKVVQVGEEKKA